MRRKIYLSDTPEYNAYCHALQRCTNKNNCNFKNYGGRGILFLFRDFKEFYSDIGKRPSRRHSLDRKNNEGHYEVGNVRWATRKQQAENRRQRRKPENASSRFYGVCWNKTNERWQARFWLTSKNRLYLGTFKSEIDAARAVNDYITKEQLNLPLNVIPAVAA